MKEIIIIEDTKLHQQKIKDAVLELGYKVPDVFAYGEKAVDYILKVKNKPDLIIIDIILEGKMNGYQAAKKISSETNIPFIFLSVQEDEIKDFEASVYLNKPFSKQELKNNIELALYKYEIYKKILKKNEEQEMILDTIDTQIWYLKDPVTYGKVNQAHANFIGLDKSDIENKKLTDFLPSDEAEVCNLSNGKVFREKKKIQTEEWVENSRGEKRLLSIAKNPKLNRKGKVEYVVCSAEDITAQRKKEKIIKESHKIAVDFKELKTEKEISKATVAAAENLLDFNLCNILLIKGQEFIPFASSSNFEQEIISTSKKSIAAKTYNKGRSFIIDDLQNNFGAAEVKKLYKSAISIPIGSYGVFQAASAEKNAFSENDLELAEILISHVTASLDRIYAKQKIIEQKAYFEQLFKNSPEAIVLLNNKNCVIKANKKFESLFGYRQSEIINKNIDDFILTEEFLEKGKKYTEKVKQGKKVKSEGIRETKNGKKINVFFQGFPIKLANGQIGVYALYNDITERKKREKQIEYLSFHDEMTGLYNRRYFENELKRLDSSRKYPITIVIGDLDSLKLINDNYGHKKGDEYLINTAAILERTARTEDVIARIGGDEFAIILPSTNSKEARRFCQRIQKNISKFNHEKNPAKALSISLGFEVMESDGQSLDEIFKKADRKMYLNKGR